MRLAGEFQRESGADHGLDLSLLPPLNELGHGGLIELLLLGHAAEVKADYALGQSVGIQHTPTIWVVTNRTSGSPFVEVVDRSRLFTLIEEAQAETALKAR